MAKDVKVSEKDKKAVRAENTSNLKTAPGSERVVADPEKGEPVDQTDSGSAAQKYKRKPSVDQVAPDTLHNVD